MANKIYIISYLIILPGIGLLGIVPLNDYIKSIGAEIILSPWLLIPIFGLLSIYVLKGVYHIAQYTDEFLPSQLGFIALILCGLGIWLAPRLLILGMVGLILAAYWTRNNVWNYYR